jgi:DNA invertase Pin-like site-specific DNA recombinase
MVYAGTMRRQPRATTGPLRVIFYTRVSSREQADSGLGLAAQEASLTYEAQRRGWEVVAVLTDAGASGGSTTKRPALAEALAKLDAGDADVIAVSKLDRLSRSVLDFAKIMVRAGKKGWGLVALDLGVDTTTPSGRLVANVMISVAEWERDVIGQRTSDALRAKQDQGFTLGRPQTLPDRVVSRIIALHESGLSLRKIASAMEADGTPTAQGGANWYGSTVRAVLTSQAADRLVA